MQTIGQRLKTAREEKQITLEKAFQATRIRVAYLQALEADDYSAMPSPVQARGYLRNYAEYLGLEIENLLDELRASKEPVDEVIGPTDEIESPIEEPGTDAESTYPSSLEVDPVAYTETTLENPPEEDLQPDVTENLWQTWLNRVSSVISVRVNRKEVVQETDERKEETIPAQEESPVDAHVEPAEVTHSSELFRDLGRQLRERRESLSLNLNEVERNTHVKAHYLESLEQGAMDRLPSTVQTRGMLSNYASFLDMDVDTILLRFADGLQARHREKNPGQPARRPDQPIVPASLTIRSFVAGDMVFGIGVAVLLVGFLIWSINYVVTLQNQQGLQPTAPSISDVLLATPDPSQITPTATFLPVEDFPEEATPTIVIPTINANVSVQVNIIAVERAFVRVIADGEVVFEGRVVPGTAYLYEAEDQIEVLVGSGAAVRIVYNGRDLGLMGGFGEIVNNIYRANEFITPTLLSTLEVTNTAPPVSTLAPSFTPTP